MIICIRKRDTRKKMYSTCTRYVYILALHRGGVSEVFAFFVFHGGIYSPFLILICLCGAILPFSVPPLRRPSTKALLLRSLFFQGCLVKTSIPAVSARFLWMCNGNGNKRRW